MVYSTTEKLVAIFHRTSSSSRAPTGSALPLAAVKIKCFLCFVLHWCCQCLRRAWRHFVFGFLSGTAVTITHLYSVIVFLLGTQREKKKKNGKENIFQKFLCLFFFFFLSYKKWIKFIFSVRGKVHGSSGTGFLASFMRVLGKQTRACKNLCLLLFYIIPETWMLLDHLQHLPTAWAHSSWIRQGLTSATIAIHPHSLRGEEGKEESLPCPEHAPNTPGL